MRITEYLLAILLIVLPALLMPYLPEVVPIHFNIYGEPDGYGSRCLLLITPVTGFLLYALIKWSGKFREYFNYPVKITPENRQMQEGLVYRLIYHYCIITLIVFNLLTTMTFFSAAISHVPRLGIVIALIFFSYILPLVL